MFLLFVGLVATAIWIARLVTRVNILENRLEQVEANLERVSAAPPVRAAAPPPPTAATPASAPPPAAPPPVVGPVTVPASARPARHEPPIEAPTASSPAVAETDADTAWEVVVGGSWLNKIGVLVFVIGLALLVGYSMAHVGPMGRIGIGFAVSVALLSGGVAMERRDNYRNYAYGLIAGGWAGTYFTTYAMRAVDAARVLESDLVAISLLVAVAGGMVAHSLRYRSPVVTALAYVVAYATLALTPLRAFALVASVPLALSVLIVAQRFAWPAVQLLGVVCTYGLYIMRGRVFGFGDLDLTTFAPYAALALYWVVFEVADIVATTRRQVGGPPPVPLFLLNAAGLVGSALLQLPTDTPMPLTTFLLLSGVAYLGSAVIRARLIAPATDGDAIVAAAYGSYQGASALAALLVAWAIEWRFTGSRQTIALLVEAEMLFLSGLLLKDGLIRAVGSALAVVTGVHAIRALVLLDPGILMWSWTAQGAAAAAALTSVVWYANREVLRARGLAVLPHEWLYTPIATYLVVLVARADLPDGYSALAVFLFAVALLEAGLRRGGREYRVQAYLVGLSSAAVLIGWFYRHSFFVEPPTIQDAWWMLVPAALAAYAAAWRLVPGRHLTGDDRAERVAAAAVAETVGIAFVVEWQWMVIAPPYVAAVWAGTAAVVGTGGLWRKVSGLRWQAYPLLVLALLRAMRPILDPVAATRIEIGSALLVIGLLYAGSLAVRGALAHVDKALADVEDAVRIGLSVVATLALGAVVYNEVRPTLVTVTWGLQAVALLAVGFPARERLMRLSGLAVLLACIVRLFGYDLPQLDAFARIISFVALGAALLCVSWIYTRYREKIQKYL